ncbi:MULTISPECIES: FKBP-type peptidyl-prolyl cis-trans isomerase N-terminal domain-containing protein [Stenotrophomonas]|jgi:FKBP-type peptidyl-prolyl cis-trans isomerase FkpA|uniref:FKBP-type peptidyl-prolyl cis-trans isomerase N-terminal domain-containing protein n=1 Tax=Stenotrophomonas TaxID=40323 RepID=UPI000702D64D|nr:MULTISPECIES: FKBP-type peptidyl-prolyl cis-trans isomerase [Stenotrophomonas]KRG84477.1 peptidylprolyl isomerase [Stenotrophomonas acidaminiphila]QOF97261.1 FKBP-type peptidyl-prolyl cis-trans isomerase [Stenotrophomonas sp. CW117]
MKMGKRGAVASLMILALAVPAAVIAQQPAAPAATKEKSVLTSEREKIGYAIGVDVASSFEPIASEVDVAALRRAVENAFAGGQPLLSQEEAQKTDQALRMAMMIRSGQQVPGMAPGSQPPAVDREKVGLMLGSYAVGPSLAPIRGDIDLDSVFQAISTIFAKGTPLMDRQQAQATLQAFSTAKQAAAAGKNREEGNAFLAKNKTQPGVVTTASGLQYQVLRAGSGERPVATSRVRVNYEGKLLDGTVFDSSYQRGQPADFGLNQVIKGWTEGVSLMPVGSKYRFWVPSELAYGSNGTPGGPIGPDATLTFDVELLGVLQ